MRAAAGGDYESAYGALSVPVNEDAYAGVRGYWFEQLPDENIAVTAFGRMDVGDVREVPLDLFGSDLVIEAQPFVEAEIGATVDGGDIVYGAGTGVRFEPFVIRYQYMHIGDSTGRLEGFNEENRVFLEIEIPIQ